MKWKGTIISVTEESVNNNSDNNTNGEIKDPLRNYKGMTTLSIDELKPNEENLFEYEDEEFLNETVESIKNIGLLHPVTVRPLKNTDVNSNFTHEILNGHTRVKAFKRLRDLGNAGYDKIAVINCEELKLEGDDKDKYRNAQATILQCDANKQKSFEKLPLSKKAKIVYKYHEANKCQGKRTDLIAKIEDLEGKPSENGKSETSVGKQQKSGNTRKATASYFGMKENDIWQYLQINKLIEPLQQKLDNREFGMGTGVKISSITGKEQEDVEKVLGKPENKKYRLDEAKADRICSISKSKTLTTVKIEEILTGKNMKTAKKSISQIIRQEFKEYFTPDQTDKEIKQEIKNALDYYRARNNLGNSINDKNR